MSVTEIHSQAFVSPTPDDMPYGPPAPKRTRFNNRRTYRPRYGRAPFGSSRTYTRYNRYGSSVRTLRIPRGPARMSFMSPSTELLNVAPSGGMRLRGYIDNSYSVSAGLGSGGNFVFDPSGTYGVHATVTIPNWGSMVALFDEYKVNKITITARYTPSDQAEDAGSCQIYFCENRDTTLTGTKAQVLNKTNLIHHVFTEEHPMVKCELTPYVFDAVYNAGVLAAYGRSPRVMDWCDVDVPAQIYGWLWNADVPSGVVQNASIRFSYEYDVSFRYRQ